MIVRVEIPEYDEGKGVVPVWEAGFILSASLSDDSIKISGNTQALISLARQILFLAQDSVPSGRHFHHDVYSALEDGSCDLIIEKI